MLRVEETRREAPRRAPGAADAARTTLRCLGCGEDLAVVAITHPEVPVTIRFRATCGHCGGASPEATLRGGFSVAPGPRSLLAGMPDRESTDPMVDIEVTIQTAKAVAR